jgi:hypothetical protein
MGEVFLLGLIVLASYLLVRFGSTLHALVFGSRYRAYRQLAAKYRGRCESRGLVDPPTVSFHHQGALVRVGLAPMVAGQNSPPRTRVVVRFGSAHPLRFELYPVARTVPSQAPRGTRPVRLGIAEFDRLYLVQANDVDITREVLLPESIRDAIEAMRRLCPPAGLLLSVNPDRMLLQIDRNLGRTVAMLDAAVRGTLLIHDWMLESVQKRMGEGVRVVEVGTSTAADLASPVCEVCGDPIVANHVVCTQCQTPCHRDCWSFVGACSTFGCGGKQFVLAPGQTVRGGKT